VGLIAGGGLAVAYPPPSTDMIKVQATEWYQHMRQLVATTESAGTRPWVGDPQIYAEAPVALPPEPATDDELMNDDVADLIDANAPAPDAARLTAALDEAMDGARLQHRMVVVDAATGETLYDRGGDDSIVPASTLNLFTTMNVFHNRRSVCARERTHAGRWWRRAACAWGKYRGDRRVRRSGGSGAANLGRARCHDGPEHHQRDC